MSEKPESEEFEMRKTMAGRRFRRPRRRYLIADLDKRKEDRREGGEPAWRALERIREERQTPSSVGFRD
jgi:hypothetical protein